MNGNTDTALDALGSPEAACDSLLGQLDHVDLLRVNGKVTQVIGLVLESIGPNCSLGDVCVIKSRNGEDLCSSEVVGFRDNRVLSMILGDAARIGPGNEIVATDRALSVSVGKELLGRVLDGLGNPLDGRGPIVTEEVRSIYSAPPNPLERQRITSPIATGIRSIDALLTVGRGQRVGIFAGSRGRQERHAGHDRPAEQRRRERHRAGRRTGTRGGRVPRPRTRRGRAQEVGGRGGDQRPGAADPHQGRR